MLRDSWRMAVGTLTAVPVKAPVLIDSRRAGIAMVLAPLAVVPLGFAVLVVVIGGDWLGLSPFVVALLAVGAVVLGNRGFHVDGLSDVADGLTASYDRERSLAVMKTGTSGPAGGAAVFVVLGLQIAGLIGVLGLADSWRAAALAGLAVCVSRAAFTIGCLRGVPHARTEGLGETYTQSVGPAIAVTVWTVGAALLSLVGWWAGLSWWRGALAAAVAALVVGVVVRRAIRRFGGVSGDVFGASAELALAALLVVLS